MRVFAFCFLAHFALFMVLLLMALDFSAVDGHEPGLLSQVARVFAEVLGQPALFLSRYLPSPCPDPLEWALLATNSLLWAGLLSALFRWWRSSGAGERREEELR